MVGEEAGEAWRTTGETTGAPPVTELWRTESDSEGLTIAGCHEAPRVFACYTGTWEISKDVQGPRFEKPFGQWRTLGK